ncbi:UDP:flavonoid glycosyltransferase YjiC, YdhE family [Algoriphagus ornithinivorans]|uniref:UDP:flavonoid glycosyltransferase YjiC, YdhE family n=1 Tax=Algoriphagus ornithinivorans TaxID=226506 RepID=A0A1I5CP21_9BACT|nr:glycosyltransferase [Algoriphagus ornithinivorans]SFN88760.1 UDP:flavonoid glycosyltransferase YjiC, YdhE family [Algoriphagus ornithinivorans]
MKILLISLGTRGDIEPFLALAEVFSKRNIEVTCLFPEQFKSEVQELGYKFLAFDRRFLELIESPTGKNLMGGGKSAWSQLKNYFKLAKESISLQKTLLNQQKTSLAQVAPDLVFFHPKALYYYLIARLDPKKYILVSPIPCIVHPSDEYPHMGLAKWNIPKRFIRISYNWVNQARYFVMKLTMKNELKELGLSKLTTGQLREFELKELKTFYALSPTLFPRPVDWPDSAQIVGYFKRNQESVYQADSRLLAWLAKYPKPVFLTFGSMTNPKPEFFTQQFIEALVKLKIPAIINCSWGGLTELTGTPDSIFFVNHIPYDWIFPKMYGVIHHGGSGTTHQSAINACVQLIIPHIMDQFFWNKVIQSKGLGPLGISIHQFSQQKLEEKLLDFYQNQNYKLNAKHVAEKMKNEANENILIDLAFPK